jgi:L-ascorbate metabolism protein UlaG (beta-lactamase superfamily)
MIIRWRGHSFFELETANGKRVLVDPFVDNGLTRASVNDFRDADLVLVTHAHGDHVGATPELNKPTITNWEIGHHLMKRGVSEVVQMNTGGFVERDGLRIWMAPALHSSGFDHNPDAQFHGYGGNPCGFIVDDGETKFHHLGDTGLFGDMKHVIRDVMKPDVAAVPIGDLFTMGPEHAAIAVEWLGVEVAIPMHYNTMPPIEQDPHAWAKRVGNAARALVPEADDAIEIVGGQVK